MLKDDKATFNRIKWRRVVLDEMQEIRSSTTDHARACEKLLCDCRWMVSGTPLYTSIDYYSSTIKAGLLVQHLDYSYV